MWRCWWLRRVLLAGEIRTRILIPGDPRQRQQLEGRVDVNVAIHYAYLHRGGAIPASGWDGRLASGACSSPAIAVFTPARWMCAERAVAYAGRNASPRDRRRLMVPAGSWRCCASAVRPICVAIAVLTWLVLAWRRYGLSAAPSHRRQLALDLSWSTFRWASSAFRAQADSGRTGARADTAGLGLALLRWAVVTPPH